MKSFCLPRQIMSPALRALFIAKVKQFKVKIARATKTQVKGIAAAVEQIEKEGIPSRFVRKKLPKNLGYGLFLHPKAKPIQKGEIIAPYAGVVSIAPKESENDSDYIFGLITDLKLTKEEQKQFDPKAKYHPNRSYAFDLDAAKKGNFVRFINHSEKPNVEAELLRIPKNSVGLEESPSEVIYIAKKKILPGEQLLVCYEGEDKTYWGALKIKPLPMTPQTFRLNS